MTDQTNPPIKKKGGRPKGSGNKTRKVGNPMFIKKYNPAMADWICGLVEDGLTVKEVCDKYKDQGMVTEKQIYRWKKEYPEFKQKLDAAYSDLLFKMIDELNGLSKEEINLRQYQDNEDIQELRTESLRRKDRREAIKVRMKALEFMLNKIAPKVVHDLRSQESHQVLQLPPITIVNYAAPKKAIEHGQS